MYAMTGGLFFMSSTDYAKKLGKEKLRDMYYKMHLIRNFENNIFSLYSKGKCS